MLRTRVLDAFRDYISAVAAGKVTLADYVSVISGTGILLFLTLDTSYALTHQTIGGVIWINIAYFVWEWAVRLRHAAQQRELRSYLLSASGFVDWVSAIAIPLAIVAGVAAAHGVPARRHLASEDRARHFRLQAAAARAGAGIRAARQRADHLRAGALCGLGDRPRARARGAACDLRHHPRHAVVGDRHPHHHRLWRRGAGHGAWAHRRRLRDDLRHRRARHAGRCAGDRLCRRSPPRAFHPHVGAGEQGSVLQQPGARRDRRCHQHAAAARAAAARDRRPQGRAGRLHVLHRLRRGRGRASRSQDSARRRAASSASSPCSATRSGQQRS